MANPIQEFSGFAISVNCVIFGYTNPDIYVLLIKEEHENAESWVIPGDGMRADEGFKDAAKRLVASLHGNPEVYLRQSMVRGDVHHINKGSLLFAVYYSTVQKERFLADDFTKRGDFKWIPLSRLSKENVEPSQIDLIEESYQRLKTHAKSRPLGFYMLKNKFTFHELQQLYEVVFNEVYDRPNFRRKLLATGLLEPLTEVQTNVGHRPAKMFRFNEEKYRLIKDRGYEFKI